MTTCHRAACCDETPHSAQPVSKSVALVGNPNCGKTTLFNVLTGARQKVGNWPGVTVEHKSGFFAACSKTIEVIDLPGVYSLTMPSETMAVDERIACEFVLGREADVIINIVDASHLERHLYLTLQLLEMGAPVILALNMIDVARARQIHIDTEKLARELGCPVVLLEAHKGSGVQELKKIIASFDQPSSIKNIDYAPAIQNAIKQLSVETNNAWLALRLLEGDVYAQRQVTEDVLEKTTQLQASIQKACDEDADILIADARYRTIQTLLAACVSRSAKPQTTWTTRIDNIVLNRVLGIPIFLGVMYLLFVFAINIGGAFQDFFDLTSQTLFVDGVAYSLTKIGAPTWLIALLANGLGKGINTTVTFIPVIGAMFLFLALLEDSGYMARAAFVIDRFMRALGLPGKAFVPMIVGFGCNVPSVMAARTLENKRDRILTIMMSPFMSCGARLAIYAVFTAAFYPHGGQNIVFALYIIGILMAIFTGFILRHTLLKGDPAPLIMELPPYHVPRIKSLFLHAWQRLNGFVVRAGKLIIPICVIIGALNSFNIDGTINTGEGDAHSVLSWIGQWTTPIFAPMGIHAHNWPATVGLVTGILAKEVVVGTLNTLYTQMGHLVAAGSVESFDLGARLYEAWQSVPNNLSQLVHAFGNPMYAQATASGVNQNVYGFMYQQFDGQIGAFAYLLFVLLYFPCISTTAAMLRELHRGWSVFSAFWMTGVAYGVAVIFYQSATLAEHPLTSCVWIVAVITVFVGTITLIRRYANEKLQLTEARMNA